MSSPAPAVLEAQAMRTLSQPTMIALDIDKRAVAPPAEGTIFVADFHSGAPVVVAAGWPKPIVLHQAPATLVAVLAGAENDKLPRLMRWLRQVGAATLPPVIAWREGQEEAALVEATRELGRWTARAVQRSADTARQATQLRAANAELRYRFALAESALLRHDALPLELCFANEPSSEPSQFDVLNETTVGLSQVLPVASTGVAAIGLHFGSGEPNISRIEVRLTTLEDARIVQQWSVAAHEIAPGWNMFGLTRALSGLDRTLQLQLLRSGSGERVPPISLGMPQPLQEFQVVDLGSKAVALTSSLAFKIWKGLPGTRLPSSIVAHQPVRRSTPRAGFVERPVAAVSLQNVELANAEAVSFDFRPVWAPPGENTATCHPPSHGVTLGRLPDAVPSSAIKVSASVSIGSESSLDVDFALVVADKPARALEILQGGSKRLPTEAFSGWLRVNAHERRRLSAFREVGAETSSLFIATRMSKPGDNSYAQARFKDFFYMVRG